MEPDRRAHIDEEGPNWGDHHMYSTKILKVSFMLRIFDNLGTHYLFSFLDSFSCDHFKIMFFIEKFGLGQEAVFRSYIGEINCRSIRSRTQIWR